MGVRRPGAGRRAASTGRSGQRGPVPAGAHAALLASPVLLTLLATPLLLGAAPPRDRPADARGTYLADCAVCHGADGRGTNRGPTLIGAGTASTDYFLSTGRMPIADPDQDTASLRRPPAYPPELIDALVAYVDDLGGPSAPEGPDIPELDLAGADVARGGELFLLQCAACHTWAGRGGALLEREAPTVIPATPVQVAEATRVGPGSMPVFGAAALTDQELNDVVAYVELLHGPENRGGVPLWYLGPLAEGLVAWVFGIGTLVLFGLWIGKHVSDG